MRALRRHVVGVMAVFFALAIGIVLGAGPLQGKSDGTVTDQIGSDGQVSTDLRSQVTGQRSSNQFSDDFARRVAPELLGRSLRGHSVTLVVLPTADPGDVRSLRDLVATAGGSVGGTLHAGKQLVDAGDKQLVDELGSQLAGRTKGVSIPDDASAYERIGALIARVVATTGRGGRDVDGTATGILSGLDTADLLSADGRLNRRSDLVLFVTGPGEGNADQQRGAGSIVTTLVSAVDAHSRGVVLAGPAAAARANGELKAVRDDAGATKDVSTVDSADRVAGQVVTILALAEQATGRSGQYGAVAGADGPMPGQ